MSKFYLFISALLIVSAVNCQDDPASPGRAPDAKPNTEQVQDKADEKRIGTLMTLDDCFSLFIGKAQLFYGTESSFFQTISVTEGHCAFKQMVPDKEHPGKEKHASDEAEIKVDLKSAKFTGKNKDTPLLIDLTMVISTTYLPSIEYWSVSNISLIGPESKEIWLVGDYLHAPLNHSYSCGNVALHKAPSSLPDLDKESFVNKFVKIVLKDFQIQPFKGDQFNDSYDCASWFSIGTFAGLLVLILFTFILAFGILYIMNIKTNDRFEDPKGKPLNLGNTDG